RVEGAQGHGSETLGDVLGQIDQAVRVAPLVVVPAGDLDEVSADVGETGVEDGRVRVELDVARDDLVLGVLEDALQTTADSSLAVHGVDLVDGEVVALGDDRQVDDRAGGNRYAVRGPAQLAVELGHDQADGLGRAGRGGDDVDRRGTCATQVAVRAVLKVLIGGVGVRGHHEAALDAAGVVEDLGERREAVRGARRVGDDVVVRGVVGVLVHAHHEGAVDVG